MYIKLLSEISLGHKIIIVERDFNNFLHTMFDFLMTRTYYSYSYNTESKRKLLGGYILQNSQFILSHVTSTYLPPYLMVTCCEISFKGQSQLRPFTQLSLITITRIFSPSSKALEQHFCHFYGTSEFIQLHSSEM